MGEREIHILRIYLIISHLHKRSPADLVGNVGRELAVLNEAALHEVLLALLLLLRVIHGDQGLGASLVVAVLAGDLLIILRPLLHKHFVYTSEINQTLSVNLSTSHLSHKIKAS